MTRPLLSLAVPTFNRVAYLSELIASVERELVRTPELATRVGIVVSDNASTDTTRELCLAASSRLTATLQYRRSATNVGGPANLVEAMRSATGEYVMYVGDDDRIAPGGLVRAIEFLERNPTAACAVFANPAGLSEELTRARAGYAERLETFEAAAAYFVSVGIPAGCAIRAAPLREALSAVGAEHLAKTNWPQTTLAFVAAHVSGMARPIAACHDALAFVSDRHLENTLYTAWICWHTWFQGPLSAAQIVEDVVGPGFVERAAEDIFTARRMRYPLTQMLDHLLSIDSPHELARFRARLEASLPAVPARGRPLATRMLARSRTPRALRIPTLLYEKLLAEPGELVRHPSSIRARVGSVWGWLRYRSSHFERLARYREGRAPNVRNYAEEGY